MIFFKIVAFSFIVYFFSWLVVNRLGINNLAIQSEDTVPAMFIPVTILKEGTLYADSYYQMILQKYPHPDDKDYQLGLIPFYFKKVITGAGLVHYISAFTLVPSLLALPVYLFPVILGMPITFGNLTILSHIIAAMVT